MANRDRDSMETQGNAGTGILGAIVLAILGGVVDCLIKGERRQNLTNQIGEKQAQLNELQRGVLSPIVNKSEIQDLTTQITELEEKRQKL